MTRPANGNLNGGLSGAALPDVSQISSNPAEASSTSVSNSRALLLLLNLLKGYGRGKALPGSIPGSAGVLPGNSVPVIVTPGTATGGNVNPLVGSFGGDLSQMTNEEAAQLIFGLLGFAGKDGNETTNGFAGIVGGSVVPVNTVNNGNTGLGGAQDASGQSSSSLDTSGIVSGGITGSGITGSSAIVPGQSSGTLSPTEGTSSSQFALLQIFISLLEKSGLTREEALTAVLGSLKGDSGSASINPLGNSATGNGAESNSAPGNNIIQAGGNNAAKGGTQRPYVASSTGSNQGSQQNLPFAETGTVHVVESNGNPFDDELTSTVYSGGMDIVSPSGTRTAVSSYYQTTYFNQGTPVNTISKPTGGISEGISVIFLNPSESSQQTTKADGNVSIQTIKTDESRTTTLSGVYVDGTGVSRGGSNDTPSLNPTQSLSESQSMPRIAEFSTEIQTQGPNRGVTRPGQSSPTDISSPQRGVAKGTDTASNGRPDENSTTTLNESGNETPSTYSDLRITTQISGATTYESQSSPMTVDNPQDGNARPTGIGSSRVTTKLLSSELMSSSSDIEQTPNPTLSTNNGQSPAVIPQAGMTTVSNVGSAMDTAQNSAPNSPAGQNQGLSENDNTSSQPQGNVPLEGPNNPSSAIATRSSDQTIITSQIYNSGNTKSGRNPVNGQETALGDMSEANPTRSTRGSMVVGLTGSSSQVVVQQSTERTGPDMIITQSIGRSSSTNPTEGSVDGNVGPSQPAGQPATMREAPSVASFQNTDGSTSVVAGGGPTQVSGQQSTISYVTGAPFPQGTYSSRGTAPVATTLISSGSPSKLGIQGGTTNIAQGVSPTQSTVSSSTTVPIENPMNDSGSPQLPGINSAPEGSFMQSSSGGSSSTLTQSRGVPGVNPSQASLQQVSMGTTLALNPTKTSDDTSGTVSTGTRETSPENNPENSASSIPDSSPESNSENTSLVSNNGLQSTISGQRPGTNSPKTVYPALTTNENGDVASYQTPKGNSGSSSMSSPGSIIESVTTRDSQDGEQQVISVRTTRSFGQSSGTIPTQRPGVSAASTPGNDNQSPESGRSVVANTIYNVQSSQSSPGDSDAIPTQGPGALSSGSVPGSTSFDNNRPSKSSPGNNNPGSNSPGNNSPSNNSPSESVIYYTERPSQGGSSPYVTSSLVDIRPDQSSAGVSNVPTTQVSENASGSSGSSDQPNNGVERPSQAAGQQARMTSATTVAPTQSSNDDLPATSTQTSKNGSSNTSSNEVSAKNPGNSPDNSENTVVKPSQVSSQRAGTTSAFNVSPTQSLGESSGGTPINSPGTDGNGFTSVASGNNSPVSSINPAEGNARQGGTNSSFTMGTSSSEEVSTATPTNNPGNNVGTNSGGSSQQSIVAENSNNPSQSIPEEMGVNGVSSISPTQGPDVSSETGKTATSAAIGENGVQSPGAQQPGTSIASLQSSSLGSGASGGTSQTVISDGPGSSSSIGPQPTATNNPTVNAPQSPGGSKNPSQNGGSGESSDANDSIPQGSNSLSGESPTRSTAQTVLPVETKNTSGSSNSYTQRPESGQQIASDVVTNVASTQRPIETSNPTQLAGSNGNSNVSSQQAEMSVSPTRSVIESTNPAQTTSLIVSNNGIEPQESVTQAVTSSLPVISPAQISSKDSTSIQSGSPTGPSSALQSQSTISGSSGSMSEVSVSSPAAKGSAQGTNPESSDERSPANMASQSVGRGGVSVSPSGSLNGPTEGASPTKNGISQIGPQSAGSTSVVSLGKAGGTSTSTAQANNQDSGTNGQPSVLSGQIGGSETVKTDLQTSSVTIVSNSPVQPAGSASQIQTEVLTTRSAQPTVTGQSVGVSNGPSLGQIESAETTSPGQQIPTNGVSSSLSSVSPISSSPISSSQIRSSPIRVFPGSVSLSNSISRETEVPVSRATSSQVGPFSSIPQNEQSGQMSSVATGTLTSSAAPSKNSGNQSTVSSTEGSSNSGGSSVNGMTSSGGGSGGGSSSSSGSSSSTNSGGGSGGGAGGSNQSQGLIQSSSNSGASSGSLSASGISKNNTLTSGQANEQQSGGSKSMMSLTGAQGGGSISGGISSAFSGILPAQSTSSSTGPTSTSSSTGQSTGSGSGFSETTGSGGNDGSGSGGGVSGGTGSGFSGGSGSGGSSSSSQSSFSGSQGSASGYESSSSGTGASHNGSGTGSLSGSDSGGGSSSESRFMGKIDSGVDVCPCASI